MRAALLAEQRTEVLAWNATIRTGKNRRYTNLYKPSLSQIEII
jgi:hypothetical protein